MLKNKSTLAVSVPVNLSIELDLVSENDPRELTLCMNYIIGQYTFVDLFNLIIVLLIESVYAKRASVNKN